MEGALHQLMANAAIAGPRRSKQGPPPLPALAQPSAQPARQQPPPNRDEPTRSRPAAAPPGQVVTLSVKRGKVHRLRWFILGIAFGAVGAVFARGEAAATLHDLRVWSARALRSLERTAPPPAKGQPSTAAPSARPVALVVDTPCPMNPGPGDPCAELLAPFLDAPKTAVPTVSIDTLPRAKPPVIARHHRHVATAPAPSPVASAPAEEPVDPPSDDEDDDSTNQVTTAENDPPPVR